MFDIVVAPEKCSLEDDPFLGTQFSKDNTQDTSCTKLRTSTPAVFSSTKQYLSSDQNPDQQIYRGLNYPVFTRITTSHEIPIRIPI